VRERLLAGMYEKGLLGKVNGDEEEFGSVYGENGCVFQEACDPERVFAEILGSKN